MTSATPQHARTNVLVRGWRAFRVWRRTRPFWGGLFTILSGLEIFATTQGSLGGLTFQMGPTGFLSWLIPTILVACGLLMWATPGQRLFYAIVAAMTAVFSLIGVNLGGFLLGLLLGMVGSALGFAWTPIAPPPPEAGPEEPDAENRPEPGDQTTVDTLLDGPEVPPQRDHRHESDVDATTEIPTQRPGPGRSPLYAITVVLLSLAVAGVTLHGGTPAHAAPCQTEAPSGAPTPTPSGTPTPAPEGEEDDGGNIITDILEGIGDLFGIGGDREEAPAAEAAPTPTPSGTQTPAAPAGPTPTPSCPPANGGTAPGGAQPGGEEDGERPAVTRVLPPPADIKAINRIPSIMTGSKLTNYNLEYHGVTDLPLDGGGTMKVLWFNMTKAVTENFELKPAVPNDRRMSIKAFPLTVEGSVRFFTPRFTGKLLGLDQVYTPASPPPLIPGIPVPVLPIVFTDVEIQLAYVDCRTLTADGLINTP
ncbi:DUF6114 domain-containing protein [Phytohabitans sp. ZYX-F-186]|uniref:DUF6114 domain-containing protein n=1 Tax=Phytohabitans maris TaxID=3071409 RepID=A0ABU0ZIG5_9ACTN|nr:DUF6114 domain-containing protein [Phytohabitans sp. ZYX-F-186]MDQ7906822.1 DUF6114 domain-containing protein [Phytohabitans sp. ZYX-F-186]